MGLKEHIQQFSDFLGRNVYYDFLLAHGREFSVGPNTYAGPRGEPKACYMNATHLAQWDRRMTYCEGKVMSIIPIDHAWCIDSDGVVVDTTLERLMLDGTVRETQYFGVPLRTDYVLRAVKLNGLYGVLDYFYAGKTAPKLFELGLEAGQQWLLDQKPGWLRELREIDRQNKKKKRRA